MKNLPASLRGGGFCGTMGVEKSKFPKEAILISFLEPFIEATAWGMEKPKAYGPFHLIFTFVGLAVTVVANVALLPRWGYYGAAWARFVAEAAMVAVSYYLNRRYFPTPYDIGRIVEYVVLGLALFFLSEALLPHLSEAVAFGVNVVIFSLFVAYAIWREKIDIKGLVSSALHRKR